ncbi:MAG: glycosyltransferase family 2 protein [Phycisphaerales bacterium]|jgi:hypothetical protein
MRLISLTLARNSAWCIEGTLRHALRYCDEAVVLCHACTDGTQDILRDIDRVRIIETADADTWVEMEHRQRTLDEGRRLMGTHFLILDDDEIVADPAVKLMRPIAGTLKPGDIAMMPMVCCWRDLDHYRSDDPRTNPFARLCKSTVFADSPDLCWHAKDGYNHHHTQPYNSRQLLYAPGDLRWMHLQHASWPRLVTKQIHYMCREMVLYGGVKANYLRSMSEEGLALTPVPDAWWPGERALIDLEAEPWQAADLKNMVDKHGIRFFRDEGIPVEQALKFWQ